MYLEVKLMMIKDWVNGFKKLFKMILMFKYNR